MLWFVGHLQHFIVETMHRRFTGVFTGVRKYLCHWQDTLITRVSAGPYVFMVTGRRLCYSQKHCRFTSARSPMFWWLQDASLSFAKTVTIRDGTNPNVQWVYKRDSTIRKTMMYQCNTVLQNSPPQARFFLGLALQYLNDLVIFHLKNPFKVASPTVNIFIPKT